MPLTRAEEQELQRLNAEIARVEGGRAAAPAPTGGLSLAEQDELRRLDAEIARVERPKAPAAPKVGAFAPRPGVNIDDLTPGSLSTLADADAYLTGQGVKGGLITSAAQKRAQRSPHSSGRAADLVFPGQDMAALAARLRKEGFNAHFEKKGQVNPNGSVATGDHIHFNLVPRVRTRSQATALGLPMPPSSTQRPRTPTPPAAVVQPAPKLPKVKPTIAFTPSATERAVEEAEAAWAQRPAFAKAKGYRPTESGPLQALMDRRVAAVRAVLADPSVQGERRQHYQRLGEQLGAVAYQARTPTEKQAFVSGTAGGATMRAERKKPLRQLPQGQYRQEQQPQQGSLLQGLREQTMLGPLMKGAETLLGHVSGAAAERQGAEQYRQREYQDPALALPPLTGKTPKARQAQVDAKNRLLTEIRGAASELVGGRPATPDTVQAGVVKRLGRPLTKWEQQLYPTLFKIAQVEATAGAQEAAGAGIDVATLGLGGPLAQAGAGLASRALARPIAAGLAKGGLAATAARAVPRAGAALAGGGGAGAPLAAAGALAQGQPLPEVGKAAGRGFLLGSAFGLLSEAGFAVLGVGLGRAGERLALNELRQRAGSAAKEMGRQQGLTAPEITALRDRVVEIHTATPDRQPALIHQLSGDLRGRTTEQPMLPPRKTGKPAPKALPAPEPVAPAPEHPAHMLQRATPEEIAQQTALATDPVEQARLQDWAERQQRRADQYDLGQRPLPLGAQEDYINSWATTKNPGYRDWQALSVAAKQHAMDDPALAQKLSDAATRVRQDWIYQYREGVYLDSDLRALLADLPREVPTDLSPWRMLTPEERARLTQTERDALLRQDITHSLQTTRPEHIPRYEVPKVVEKNLENYADQLHQQAQARLAQLSDEAAARGPVAEPAVAAPETPAEVAPPVAEVPPAVAAPEPALAGEVATPTAETRLAVPPAKAASGEVATEFKPDTELSQRIKRSRATGAPALAKEAATRTTDEWQAALDAHNDKFPWTEGSFDDYLKSLPKEHLAERSRLVDLLNERGRQDDDAVLHPVLENLKPESLKGPVPADDLRVAIRELYIEELQNSVLRGRPLSTAELLEKLFSKTHQDAIKNRRFPEALKGDLDEAISHAQKWPDSHYGTNPGVLLNQLYSVVEDILGPTATTDLPKIPRFREVVEKTAEKEAFGALPPAKEQTVQERAAAVERDYKQQGYSPDVAKGEGDAVTAQARAATPRARTIRGEDPVSGVPESGRKGGEVTGGGGGVGVPPSAGQGPAAAPPKKFKGARPGTILVAPEPRGQFPQKAEGPTEWQFSGPREQYFQENFGRGHNDWLDDLREIAHFFKTGGREFITPGRIVNLAVSLPKNAFYAGVRQKLIRTVGGFSRGQDEALERMFGAYGKLDQPETMLVNRVALVNDMWEDVQTQLAEGVTPDQATQALAHVSQAPGLPTRDLTKVKLPEPWTVEDVYREWTRLNGEAAKNPQVAEAIESRRAMWKQTADEYADAYEAVMGRRPNLSRRDYFRHEVFLYQLGKSGLRRGEGVSARALPLSKQPSFTKMRTGTVHPYQTNMLDADHGVMAQMLYQTQLLKTWKEVTNFDIRPELERQAAMWRAGRTVIEEPTAAANVQKLGQMADRLPDTADGKYRLLIQALAKNHTDPQWVASIAGADSTIGRELAHYVKWLRARKGGVPADLRTVLPLRGVTEREAFHRNLEGRPTVTYRDLHIPEGYTEVTGVGNVFERAWKSQEVVDEMLDLNMRALTGETPKMLPGEVQTQTGRYDTIIVPKKLADVIQGMRSQELTGYRAVMAVGHRRMMSGWKAWKLGSPTTVVGYNLRNLTGDAEPLFVGNRAAFKKVGRAAKELHAHLVRGEAPSDELREWLRRGGLSGTLTNVEDVGNQQALAAFASRFDSGSRSGLVIPDVIDSYWKKVRMTSDFREGLLRYADYLDTLEHLEKKGKLRNYGASVPEEIDAIPDIRDKAYKHANDLLGAFDEVSVAGQALRQGLVPFFSFQEVNAKRWLQLGKNAWDDPARASAVGRRVFGAVGARAVTLGAFALKATAMSAMLDSYNRLRWHEEEMSLPPDIRNRPHLILGRGPDGRVQYLSSLGAISALTSFFGVDNPHGFAERWLNGETIPNLIREVREGKKTPGRAVAELALGPRASLANSVVDALKANVKDISGMLGPYKAALELATGHTLDLQQMQFKPVRERAQFLAQQMNLGQVYRLHSPVVAQRPDWKQRMLGISSVGLHEGSYSETRKWVSDYVRRFADESHRRFAMDTPERQALYQLGRAKQLGDQGAFDANLLEYALAGGTQQKFAQNVTKLSPLGGMPLAGKGGYRREFLGRLTDQEWEQVQRGYDSWAQTWVPKLELDKKVKLGATKEETAMNRYVWSALAEAQVRQQVAGDMAVLTLQMQEAERLAKEKAVKRAGERAGYVPGLSPSELRE